jgi:hypothetical protein
MDPTEEEESVDGERIVSGLDPFCPDSGQNSCSSDDTENDDDPLREACRQIYSLGKYTTLLDHNQILFEVEDAPLPPAQVVIPMLTDLYAWFRYPSYGRAGFDWWRTQVPVRDRYDKIRAKVDAALDAYLTVNKLGSDDLRTKLVFHNRVITNDKVQQWLDVIRKNWDTKQPRTERLIHVYKFSRHENQLITKVAAALRDAPDSKSITIRAPKRQKRRNKSQKSKGTTKRTEAKPTPGRRSPRSPASTPEQLVSSKQKRLAKALKTLHTTLTPSQVL